MLKKRRQKSLFAKRQKVTTLRKIFSTIRNQRMPLKLIWQPTTHNRLDLKPVQKILVRRLLIQATLTK